MTKIKLWLSQRVEKITVDYEPIYSLLPKFIRGWISLFIWWGKHRDFQREAISACKNMNIGQISLPTGTGKTRVQIALHLNEMMGRQWKRLPSCVVIASHRLVLNNQLLKEFASRIKECELQVILFFLGSGKVRYKDENFEVLSGLTENDLTEAYNKAQQENKHLVIASTYHSFDKLTALPYIDLCTCDEAHSLTSDLFMENLQKVRILRKFFFTATRREDGGNRGMDNKENFGNILYQRYPLYMIERGEIVRPWIHNLDTEPGDYSNPTMLVNSIMDAFIKHKKAVKDNSCQPELIGAKLLVTHVSNYKMWNAHRNGKFVNFAKEKNIKVFAFGSQDDQFSVNFQKTTRENALYELGHLKDDEDAILFHVDMLTEGIDIPSMTGVMFFSAKNITKILQTVGRATRLFPLDREKLYAGEITPYDIEKMIKPYCWILLPEFFKNLRGVEEMKANIREIYNAIEIPVDSVPKLSGVERDGYYLGMPVACLDMRNDKTTQIHHSIEAILLDDLSQINMIPIFEED
jgi:superfamily II DNA or RNA helicase